MKTKDDAAQRYYNALSEWNKVAFEMARVVALQVTRRINEKQDHTMAPEPANRSTDSAAIPTNETK